MDYVDFKFVNAKMSWDKIQINWKLIVVRKDEKLKLTQHTTEHFTIF